MKILKYINKILPLFKNRTDLTKFNNILVVSNTGLGDTILGTPAIKTLRKSFPNINITFLVNEKIYPLFEDFTYVDDIITYKSGFISQIKTTKILREKNIDTIFLLHSNAPEDIFFSILSGACNIFKMSDNVTHPYKNLFVNKLDKYSSHIIEEKLKLVKFFNPSIIDSTMEISNKYKKEINKNRKANIGIQVGAQDLYKLWPIKKFIEFTNLVLKSNDITITLLGATKFEQNLCEELIENSIKKENIVNLCGKSSIENLPNIINKLDMLITNDTGTFHLAVAQKIPTISLFGPTNYKTYGPFQDFEIHDVIQKDGSFINKKPKKERGQEGMDLIEVNEVLEIFNKKLKSFK